MQLLRSKRFVAVAAPALLLGGVAATYGLLQPLTSAAPGAQLTAPASTRVAAFSPADVVALASIGTPSAAPQQAYSGYAGYRDAILSLGGGFREFYFTRGIYSGWRGYGRRGRGDWATDYPKADRQFLWGLKRLTNIDAYDNENAILLTDPDLRRYPFLYMLEVGSMQLTPPAPRAACPATF